MRGSAASSIVIARMHAVVVTATLTMRFDDVKNEYVPRDRAALLDLASSYHRYYARAEWLVVVVPWLLAHHNNNHRTNNVYAEGNERESERRVRVRYRSLYQPLTATPSQLSSALVLYAGM